MSRSKSRILLLIGGAAMCALIGVAAGRALASGYSTAYGANTYAVQSDPPTPAWSGTGSAGGSLAQNPPVDDPTDTADNGVDIPEADISGTVTQVDLASATITLATPQGSVLVDVAAQTDFGDGLNTLSDVHSGMALNVSGQTQSNGHVAADSVDSADSTADPTND